MRHVIYVAILLLLAGMAVYHTAQQAWLYLSIDAGIALYAWRAWRPFKR